MAAPQSEVAQLAAFAVPLAVLPPQMLLVPQLTPWGAFRALTFVLPAWLLLGSLTHAAR
jgi:hypothetical protein